MSGKEPSTIMRTLIALSVVPILLCSCRTEQPEMGQQHSETIEELFAHAAKAKKQSGDFGGFLTKQISMLSVNPATNRPVPKLRGSWYSESYRGTFMAELYGVPFGRVQKFLQEVYGPPLEKTDSEAGMLVLCSYDRVGACVMCFSKSNRVGFVCTQFPARPGDRRPTDKGDWPEWKEPKQSEQK
jgi:hypothetical protein